MPFFAFIINLFLYLTVSDWANAFYDPASVPNNKVGIHILFTSEVAMASKIVNDSGRGAWGYVTIPIQATDRDREKWQKFFDQCSAEKLIPIMRVATVPEGSNWARPGDADLIDFANFLNDLQWPTQNRYVIIFNEVNRSDEYGGSVSPEDYADVLSNAINIFKSKSADFFILPAGLDNAAANSSTALNWRYYLSRMETRQPGIFSRIDGWTSHAYPNPEFSSRPDISGSNRIDSYRHDLKFISQYTDKKLPVFITEAGWSNKYLTDRQVAIYYKYAFDNVWSDPVVVAITPFLLNAQDGPFKQFSFLDKDGNPKQFAAVLAGYATVGEPVFATAEDSEASVQADANTTNNISSQVLGARIWTTPIDTFLQRMKQILSNIKILSSSL